MSRARLGSLSGLPISPAGLLGEPFQKVAVLLEVKVLRDPVHPFEVQGVAAEIGVARAWPSPGPSTIPAAPHSTPPETCRASPGREPDRALRLAPPGPEMWAWTRASGAGAKSLSRTSAEIFTRPSSNSMACRRRRPRGPACPQRASAAVAARRRRAYGHPEGRAICQRHVPPVARMAVRPRP